MNRNMMAAAWLLPSFGMWRGAISHGHSHDSGPYCVLSSGSNLPVLAENGQAEVVYFTLDDVP